MKKIFVHLNVWVIVLMVSCSSSGSAGSWTVTITGKVGHPQDKGLITIQELKEDGAGGNPWMDTIHLASNYTFEKKVPMKEPGYYRINFYDKQHVDLILYKSDVQVSVDGNNPGGFVEVKGSPDMDLIMEVQKIAQRGRFNPDVDKLNDEYSKAKQAGNDQQANEVLKKYEQLQKVSDDSIADVMRKAEPSLAVINMLQSGNILDKDQYFGLYKDVAADLQKEWPNYTYAKSFIAYVDKLKTVAVGQMAPEIALPNPDGNIVKLSSLRGKYVLVDFWAKWCGPCRQESPNLVRAYKEFKDKGFEIYSVSLDRNKADWVEAIKEDNLTWTHVSDLKFWNSEAAKTYNINSIPFSVLLDPTGKIIAKNLRGQALDDKLQEIFGG
jgi:peroxiredoxin